MSKIRDMIDSIADENFDGAKSALKASLAEYMAGRKFLSNRDLYGKDYTIPNEEEQSIKAGLSESTKKDNWVCTNCGTTFYSNLDWPEKCPSPSCGSRGAELTPYTEE